MTSAKQRRAIKRRRRHWEVKFHCHGVGALTALIVYRGAGVVIAGTAALWILWLLGFESANLGPWVTNPGMAVIPAWITGYAALQYMEWVAEDFDRTEVELEQAMADEQRMTEDEKNEQATPKRTRTD